MRWLVGLVMWLVTGRVIWAYWLFRRCVYGQDDKTIEARAYLDARPWIPTTAWLDTQKSS